MLLELVLQLGWQRVQILLADLQPFTHVNGLSIGHFLCTRSKTCGREVVDGRLEIIPRHEAPPERAQIAAAKRTSEECAEQSSQSTHIETPAVPSLPAKERPDQSMRAGRGAQGDERARAPDERS